MGELIRELKRAGVLRSPHVEAAFRAIDRKDFVPPEYRGEAYANYPLPIGSGQTISQPYTVAFMLDLLDPRPGERILDVGAGSGWQAALLAHIVSREGGAAGKVLALERIPALCRLARSNISKYGFIKSGAVELFCRDAGPGLPEAAPFDKIILAAAPNGPEGLPPAFAEELEPGGTLVAPIRNSIWRFVKTKAGDWRQEEYPGFAFVPFVADQRRRPRSPPESITLRAGARWPRRLRPFIIAALVAAMLLLATFVPRTLPSSRTRVDVPEGAGVRTIASLLKSRGVIHSKWIFIAYAVLTGQAGTLKAGAYDLGDRIALPGLIRMLVRGGQYPNERLITIPEGWDLRDIAAYFEELGIAPRSRLFALTGAPGAAPRPGDRFPPTAAFTKSFWALAAKPPAANLEGYLYPDTYRVFRDAPLERIVEKMVDNLERKLALELREEIRRQGRSVFEILTIASLVEQEVAAAGERRIVAGILWKRLEAGMPLQVDAAINYITGKRETPSAGDLLANSPYNTYRNRGLPPGPISNPGLEAIRAAIYPEASGYLYYLSAPDGTTIFSRTLEEHNAAKAEHLGR